MSHQDCLQGFPAVIDGWSTSTDSEARVIIERLLWEDSGLTRKTDPFVLCSGAASLGRRCGGPNVEVKLSLGVRPMSEASLLFTYQKSLGESHKHLRVSSLVDT